ncbi:MAG: hypothetical protein A3F84_12700 [Candidatus Handelsmanbacteria bacterium RIFCSPLOWO2_12_FULL_64_10]|uniref:Uncharacterized protein n=1 Tax=Handelsmanbacteria sp. (strain RIFCSPLOWO2_12_FULL_64_10) TaxID=1817868 RepID=A0A1F6CWI9_HANXR|nr:MAG: hypothetical protein A3F84_12700 [Candidatus Handelsmanbacteria bacterium RIFCSPLOWO2_12_FULL_64_10]
MQMQDLLPGAAAAGDPEPDAGAGDRIPDRLGRDLSHFHERGTQLLRHGPDVLEVFARDNEDVSAYRGLSEAVQKGHHQIVFVQDFLLLLARCDLAENAAHYGLTG